MSPNVNDLATFLKALDTRVSSSHIDLSLARMQHAAKALSLIPFPIPVITVAGTNGKGSVVCALESIYTAAGYQVGSYTSPHLLYFNERLKLNAKPVTDAHLLAALEATNACATAHQLTYFETITLAALWFFKQQPLDLLILEVGLGGRLDAVNIIDPNLCIITTIDLDHTERLGATREAIAAEKAGIFRVGVPIVCGDKHPPEVLRAQAAQLHAPFYGLNQSFHYHETQATWAWQAGQTRLEHLPRNGLLLENMSVALAAVMQLQSRFPVSDVAIKQGLQAAHLPGRQQIIVHHCKQLFDVAHNPAGLKVLAERIKQEKSTGRVLLVFSMLADKDLLKSCAMLHNEIDAWFIAPLENERAASLAQLQAAVQKTARHDALVYGFNDLARAYQAALHQAQANDLLVVAGSFYTVAQLLPRDCK